MKSKKMIGMTALLGLTALTSAFAASTSTAGMHSSSHKGKRGGREMKTLTAAEKAAHEGELAQDLASALGTTKETVLAQFTAKKTVEDIIKASGQDVATVEAKLKAAHDAEMKAKLAAAVSSGKITQEKADKMTAALATGKGMRTPGGKGFDKTKMIQDIATVLNIPLATVESQITAGKKPLDIVTASGMSQADFETKMKALRMVDMKTKLQAEVTAGTITQAEADSKLAKMAAHKEGMKGMKSTVRTVKSALGMSQ